MEVPDTDVIRHALLVGGTMQKISENRPCFVQAALRLVYRSVIV